MASKNDLWTDYLNTVDNIIELIENNAELDITPVIWAGKNPNEIVEPTIVMDGPVDYSAPICGSCTLTTETIKFAHNVTPQMILTGFEYFKLFVSSFARVLVLEKQQGGT